MIFFKSIYFRIVLLVVGAILIPFYGILLAGAVANLPVSFLGFMYALAGLASGICCFVYYKKSNMFLLIPIIIFTLLMSLTFLDVVVNSE